MRCPRRGESVMGSYPGEDRYEESDKTCSYCGSLDPEVFMQRLEAGDVELGPTDKSYKVYVRNVGGATFLQTYRNCYEMSKPALPTCKGPDDCSHWVTRETSQAKFYFQHLTDEQKQRFVELYNQHVRKERVMKIGYPGYFYSLPFFMVPLK